MTQPTNERKELTCQRCSVEHPVWSVTTETWEQVVDSEHFLCPTCFIVLAEKRRVYGFWRLTLDTKGYRRNLYDTTN